MAKRDLGSAINEAIEDAMEADERIILFGEDTPMIRGHLVARFGNQRVFGAPISESAFLGAAAGAAMEGLRPVVELYMVDFLAVAFDAVLNHMAKLETFSGGDWTCPLLIRAPSGGGYGDGGQHGQSLWGTLAAIPGLTVVVPSCAADAYALTRTALKHDGPVILLEPKLLSEEWLEFFGRLGRENLDFDVPAASRTTIDKTAEVPFGQASILRTGGDVTIVSLAVGVHRSIEAAELLASEGGPDCEVIDLRSVRPLDHSTVLTSVTKTGRLLVVDEDYRDFGLSGELAAIALEAGLSPKYARVCVEDTLPYARHLEKASLPNAARIAEQIRRLAD
jgi:pyruvate dehydrogenase E1 component beta subunit